MLLTVQDTLNYVQINRIYFNKTFVILGTLTLTLFCSTNSKNTKSTLAFYKLTVKVFSELNRMPLPDKLSYGSNT